MTDKTEDWVNNRVLYLKGLKSRTEQQNILIELFDKQHRTPQDDKKLNVLVRAEKAIERANKAKQAASNLIQATKTGKPTMDKDKLLGALLGLSKVPASDTRQDEWKKAGAAKLAEQPTKI